MNIFNARVGSEISDSSSDSSNDSLNQRVGSDESSEFESSQAIISRLFNQLSPERQSMTAREILNESEMSHIVDFISTDSSSDIVVELDTDQRDQEISYENQVEDRNQDKETESDTNTDKPLSIFNVSDQDDIENVDQPSFEE